ncbi:Ig-like domain-containing protein [Oceanicola sp. S124]|uniref:Ig-like domain-containing protein n=1 Tax=Oceanicola sp. S124 TaxID=1042378 RepID=UPI00030601D3|nr:Ig-like domain-containing protein [Oceanicola sp. S124]
MDAAGNGNTASVTREATYDGTAPTFTLDDLQGPQNGNQFTSRVTFSEPVTGLALADLSLTNATAELTPVSATVWDIVLTALSAGTVGYEIGAGAVEDAAGNANTATGAKSTTFGGIAEIELRGAGLLIPPGSASPVTGNGTDMGTHEFPAGTTRQFTISNPGDATLTLTQISDDDDNFSVSVAAMTIAPGESTTLSVTYAPTGTGAHSATVTIASNAYGQTSYAFEVSAVSQDTTAPEPTIAALTGPVNGAYTTTITFTEDVAAFAGSDLTLVNATATVSGTAPGDSFTVTVTPSGQGSFSVAAPAGLTEDGAGNPSTAAGPVSAIHDSVPPQVTISELSGPTNGIYSATVTFSEPVTGLSEQDLTLVNATASLTGSGTDYQVALSPLADGLVSLSIPADAAQDAAGNGNLASATRQATYDSTSPTAQLSPLSGPDNGVYTATLTFSEPVTGLSSAGLALVNATATISGSGQNYTLEITPSGPGVLSVQVQANAAADAAGNGNTASLSRSATFDGTAPTVQLSTGGDASYSGRESLTVAASFSEPVTGFEIADVQVSGGSVTGLSGSGADYVLTVQSSGTGDLTLHLPAGAAEDAAGNLSEASNLLSLTNTVVEESREAIARFLIQRNAALLASQPRLTDLMGGDTGRSFALQASPGMFNFSFDGALSRSVWMQLDARRSSGDGLRSDYLFGVIGTHVIASDQFVAGAMLQFDHMGTRGSDPAIEGTGWLAGPYVAGRIGAQPLRYEARLLYGQTSNNMTLGATPEVHFETERWLAQARLAGRITRGIYTLEPSLGVAHVEDRQKAYEDGFGNPVAGQTAALTEIDLGLDVSWPVTVASGELSLTGGIAVVWAKTHTRNAPLGTEFDIDGLRGRLSFGLGGRTHSGLTYALGLDYDGLGSDQESLGAKLEVGLTF